MASTLFLGGIFNVQDPIFFIPLYIWSWPAIIILTGIMWAVMYYRGWKPLEPLHGLYYALKNGSTVAFIFDGTLVGELLSERDAKCIFDYSDHNFLTGEPYEIDVPNIPLVKRILVWFYVKTFYYPTVYLPNIDAVHALIYKIGKVNKDVEIARVLEGGVWERSAAVVCAGVPVDLVVDTDNWSVKTSRQHKAIVPAALEWNAEHPKDQVHSYRKFQDYLMNGNIPCPTEITITRIVPWQRIDAAFPLDLDENEWAGKKRQMAKDLEEADTLALNKLAMWVFLGGIGMAILLLLVRFGTIVMTTPH